TSLLFVALGRMALTDATLVLWTTGAAFAFFRAHVGPPPRRRWYLSAWTLLALAALTKGPVGVIVPVVGIAAYLAVAGRVRQALRGPPRCSPPPGSWRASSSSPSCRAASRTTSCPSSPSAPSSSR